MLTRTLHNRGGLPPLEAADKALVEHLIADPRASGRDLAKCLGCSEANVSRRLTRLIAEHAIRVRAFMPFERAGLVASGIVIVRAEDPKAVADRLAAQEWTNFVAVAGPPDGACEKVVVQAASTCGARFLDHVDRDIATDPSVTSIEYLTVLGGFGTPDAPTRTDRAWRGGRPLDRINRAIIRELQRDGRATFATLGSVAGISSTAAAERFRHLVDEGLIRMTAIAEPTRMGLGALGLVLARPRGPAVAAMAAATAVAHPRFVALVSGAFPLALEIAVESRAAMEQTVRRLRDLPQIAEVRMLGYHEIVKESFVWCPADDE